MLIMAGMGGLDKDTQEGVKSTTLKKKNPKLLRVPACLVERQDGYEQMFNQTSREKHFGKHTEKGS